MLNLAFITSVSQRKGLKQGCQKISGLVGSMITLTLSKSQLKNIVEKLQLRCTSKK